ncbi:ROK family transcriptional regulator [Microterricola viridarii]|uniref:Sugar kinase of the NBD/HSP70 family, may contain an N-terminal HTH domain n=1 Tax=Microterricola viridarii TaxID=412690 RepID=A0A1H1LKR4_9MICO|nr:ROK family transcriptional regulator [Microterricola viridarii]SDR75136.1 Sugar kinase of the NBD/HSP70 family, may contain an N-terminal HTH domain [Microterricola viridarii]
MAELEGAHALVRRTHEERVLRALRELGALSRAEISERVGLSRTTTSEITAELIQRRAIVVVAPDAAERAGRGRPAERLVLDPGAGQVIGIDFSHGRVYAVVVDASQQIIAAGVADYGTGSAWTERAEIAFALLDRLKSQHEVHYGALQGIGLGFPGPFSANGARLALGRDRRDTSAVDGARELLQCFTERFAAPVHIDNNARLAGLAEAIWGGQTPSSSLLYLRLSQGLGGGLVLGGTLETGASGYAGEIGHITVAVDGLDCRCGKRGCLETIASIPAVLAECARRGATLPDLDALQGAAENGDPIVTAVLREVGVAVGRVLGGLATALDPAEIVIGGPLALAAPMIVDQARASIAYELLPIPQAEPVVRAATLGSDDGARGAVAAVLRRSSLLERYQSAPASAPTDFQSPVSLQRSTT